MNSNVWLGFFDLIVEIFEVVRVVTDLTLFNRLTDKENGLHSVCRKT